MFSISSFIASIEFTKCSKSNPYAITFVIAFSTAKSLKGLLTFVNILIISRICTFLRYSFGQSFIFPTKAIENTRLWSNDQFLNIFAVILAQE